MPRVRWPGDNVEVYGGQAAFPHLIHVLVDDLIAGGIILAFAALGLRVTEHPC